MNFGWFSAKFAKTTLTRLKVTKLNYVKKTFKSILLYSQLADSIETSLEWSLGDSLPKLLKRLWPNLKWGHKVKSCKTFKSLLLWSQLPDSIETSKKLSLVGFLLKLLKRPIQNQKRGHQFNLLKTFWKTISLKPVVQINWNFTVMILMWFSTKIAKITLTQLKTRSWEGQTM